MTRKKEGRCGSSRARAKFPLEMQAKYNKSRKLSDEFSPSWVMKEVFDTIEKKNIKKQLSRIYGQLCNYTHPNFLGWTELMGVQDKTEVLLDLPTLEGVNAGQAIKMALYLTQYSFKTS